ncbi:MAG: NADH:ubiquinone reductase (Na(+)-transporting) subunit C [Bacteroidales bacterium]|nr:NADH:ubiquinone reductase (Na(+)-transporting) subunit C [Bacteroidales bacterium]
MHSNRYIFIYSSILVIVVAMALTVVAVQLKPLQENNIRIEKMQNILSSIHVKATVNNAEEMYSKYIVSSFVINASANEIKDVDAFKVNIAAEHKKSTDDRKLPVFVAKLDNGDTSLVFPVYGKGLWGPVWGYISLQKDFNTVLGVVFDHKGETPGLGAEINTEWFQERFNGKTLFNEDGKFTSVQVLKGTHNDDPHVVDAISGSTITCSGVSLMLVDCMELYEPFLKAKLKR